MRPLVYSAAAAVKHGQGWTRTGQEVIYHENGVQRRDKGPGKNGEAGPSHSTLSWAWTAEYPNDTCYFAMCYPYTYTDLRAYLARLQADPLRARHVRRQRLALTIAGNECEMLWVTDHASPAEAVNARPVVALSARVHPGESNASWVMQVIQHACMHISAPLALSPSHTHHYDTSHISSHTHHFQPLHPPLLYRASSTSLPAALPRPTPSAATASSSSSLCSTLTE